MEALIWTAGISFLAVTTENVPPNPRMLITAFPAVIVLADACQRPSVCVARFGEPRAPDRRQLAHVHRRASDASAMTVSARTKLTPSPVGAVVLGVSRSGTSLASGSLVAAGFCVGRDQDLMPASSANPAGHWENMTVYRANEELLAAAGGSWFSPPSRDAQLSIQARASDRLRDLLCLLREHADHRPLVIKDPRVAALLDLWGPLIDGLLHPVLVVRDPVEIALSLAGARRDAHRVRAGELGGPDIGAARLPARARSHDRPLRGSARLLGGGHGVRCRRHREA